MEYIKKINNKNLKKLLKKHYLTEETVREIKTSFFIHPSTSEGDDLYSFNYNIYGGCKVIELFTSLEEYNQLYNDFEEYVPLHWYFNQFEHSFDEDTTGIIINPASDRLFIPYNVSFLIMEDMDEVNKAIEFNTRHVDVEDLRDLKSEFNYLNEYLENKSKITYITRLFDILGSSVVYVMYESEEPLDDYFKEDIIKIQDVNVHYYKKDNNIVVFTDIDDFKLEMDSKYHYCYGIADLITVIQTVFELDYNGVILKTPENEFELARHRLLKYWEKIIERYSLVEIASQYAFKIEAGLNERL